MCDRIRWQNEGKVCSLFGQSHSLADKRLGDWCGREGQTCRSLDRRGGNFVLESVRIDRNLKGIRCVG